MANGAWRSGSTSRELKRPLNKSQGHSFWYQSISHIRLPIQAVNSNSCSRTHRFLATIHSVQTISNLSLISKIIEHVVKSRLTDRLVSNGLLNPTSLPTASITPLKQLCCIGLSMIISSMSSNHRNCHVFASLICLPLLTPSTTTS